jgi:hypothetical protein
VSDLHEDLNTVLGAVEPGAAPVEAAMLTGRKIRNRRRAGLLAGAVAVVVAVVVGVPAFAHQAALPAPATSHIRVTVNPPGPHSPAGLIASGLIGTAPWTLVVKSPKSDNCMITGDGLAVYACNGDTEQPTAAAPITFEGEGGDSGQDPDYISFGEVWKDVVSARVELSDGTTLTLYPVEVDGLRYAAFANPASVPVDSVTAYSRSGAIATAIPYTSPAGLPSFAAWLRPGQPRPREFSGAFGSGISATAYVGPWGTCLEAGGTGDCIPATGALGTAMMVASSSAVYGSAAERVSYLTITRKDGTTVRAAATAIGPQKFWAVPLSWAQQAGARWTAYDDAGKAVGSGSVGTG